VPEFFVQAPDGKREWAEIDRQAVFRRLMREAAPRVMIEANANAGKRNPSKARKEGIVAGVFDMSLRFRPPLACWIEFKGYSQRRPGTLSDAQIAWGNRQTALGWPVACFFDPFDAADWVRAQRFPVAHITRRA
jgi:hypothetical protein